MKSHILLTAIVSFFLFSCKPEENKDMEKVAPCDTTVKNFNYCGKKYYDIITKTFDREEAMVTLWIDDCNPDNKVFFLILKDSTGSDYTGYIYVPCNLPESYKIEEKKIIFSGKVRNCLNSVFPCNAYPLGELIELTYIKSKY